MRTIQQKVVIWKVEVLSRGLQPMDRPYILRIFTVTDRYFGFSSKPRLQICGFYTAQFLWCCWAGGSESIAHHYHYCKYCSTFTALTFDYNFTSCLLKDWLTLSATKRRSPQRKVFMMLWVVMVCGCYLRECGECSSGECKFVSVWECVRVFDSGLWYSERVYVRVSVWEWESVW